jgi:hypothetical protein
MWAKHCEMLAPLTDFVGECGKKKHQREEDQEVTLALGSNSSTSI